MIAGQDEMLERVFVCLLAGGHLLIEGVPGLAKTLTVKTVADVFGGRFERIQFTPDLVPADLVGTRMYSARSEQFDIELGPVFCNFLLADEINRAPAKVQSALLEVMQERQVTIGKETYPVPRAVPRDGDAEPDRVRGHVPAARGAGRPLHAQDRRRLPGRGRRADRDRARARRPGRRSSSSSRVEELAELQLRRARVYVDPAVSRYALELALATRQLADHGLEELAQYVAYGASPRGPINLVLGARALAAPARPPLRAARRTSASSRRTCCATGWC